MESPHAYVPDSVIDSARLRLKDPIESPEDFIVADFEDEMGSETLICISDAGAKKRVHCFAFSQKRCILKEKGPSPGKVVCLWPVAIINGIPADAERNGII